MKLYETSWFWGLVGATVILIVFGVFTAVGWPGEPDDCVTDPNGNCYCEAYVSPAVDPRGVKQPSNTWSGLAPILAGVIILYWGDQLRFRRTVGNNPMAEGTFYSIFYGALVIFLGPGSMFFHGSLTRWGGFVDNFSMVLYIGFLIQYNLWRIFKWDSSKAVFAIVYAVAIIALAIPSYLVDGAGLIIFIVLVVGEILFEGAIMIWKPGGVDRRGGWGWLVAALATFGVSAVIWWLSWTNGPWCDPNSALQGHIFWHILAMAATPFLVFLYLRQERRT
ncbi:MAG: ceramidase domain-containing protein [bacterium]|nr:ceramidase domain-containing protein [bacterium]